MNKSRFWFACFVICIFIVVYEWFFHGFILDDTYQTSPSVWRPQETMGSFMLWTLAGKICLFMYITGFLPVQRVSGV